MIFLRIGDNLNAAWADGREGPVNRPAAGPFAKAKNAQISNIPVADMSSPTFRPACCLFLALLLSACVIVPDQRHYAGGVVMVAPPPPREEVIGVAPAPGEVWLGGYWSWVGDRHEWVPGHWAAPRPGRHWVAHQWVRQGDGWRMKPGHWERG